MKRTILKSTSPFKGKISATLKHDRVEHSKSARWLNNDVPFDPSYKLNEDNRILSDILFNSLGLKGGYKLVQKKKDFEILIANLLDHAKRPVSISLNRNDWKQTKYNPVSYFVIQLINTLNVNNLIEMKIGNNIDPKLTRIWATEKLLKSFPEYHSGVRYKPVQLVEVRDDKKNLIEYQDTAEVWRIRGILERANKINNEANVFYVTDHISRKLETSLVAIFTNKLTLGGRLYTRGISRYQGLSSEERQNITINDNSTIELDYKGLHPYLLYAAEGIQYRGDPYLAIKSNPFARPFLKQILLCMLNSKDFTMAERASNNWLYHNTSEKKILATIGITKARPLMERLIEVHKPISHYFCKGKESGQRIINNDSKIALDVINHFVKQDIPILSIHDSFIVEKQYRKELENVMRSTYIKHTGFRIAVK